MPVKHKNNHYKLITTPTAAPTRSAITSPQLNIFPDSRLSRSSFASPTVAATTNPTSSAHPYGTKHPTIFAVKNEII